MRYLLAGDISLSMLSYMSCVYFGKERFEEISGEISTICISWCSTAALQSINWRILPAFYSDLNGDSARDEDDRYGMGAVTASTTDHLTFDSGITFTIGTPTGCRF